MYKKILVAIDESERAFRALEEAVLLSEHLSAQLIVLYINKPYVHEKIQEPLDLEKIEEKVQNGIVLQTEEIWYKVDMLLPGLKNKAKFIAKESKNVAKAIVDEANKQEADLIVLGGRKLPGASSLILRSVSTTVLGISNKPVLVVR